MCYMMSFKLDHYPLGTWLVFLILGGVVVGLVLIVVWIILPFAIIGTKPILREILAEQKRTNELLEGANVSLARVDVNTRFLATHRDTKAGLER